MHWVDLHERLCPLFTIENRFPKLDVAGSIPVSRSMFSISYWKSRLLFALLNALIAFLKAGDALAPENQQGITSKSLA